MTHPAHLVLEDGSAYRGLAFGDASQPAHGEVVFNTSMTGYQEILTDPSYAGQIVVPTYPLIGNYGINRQDFESGRIQVSGFVVREHCDAPSHPASEMTLDEFLRSQGVLGISGVDTRAITRRLRSQGVMMGTIALDETPEQALARLRDLPTYEGTDFVREVSTPGAVCVGHPSARCGADGAEVQSSRERLRAEVQHPSDTAHARLRGDSVSGHCVRERAACHEAGRHSDVTGSWRS